MNTNQCTMTIRGIEVLVLRKKIKNLHLNVLPPNGAVRVSAPLNMNDDAIHTFLATRLSWIKKQQAKFKGQERQTLRKYVSGESHYFLGKRYRLEVKYVDSKTKVEIVNKKRMVLSIRPGSDIKKREQVLQNWYRKKLREILTPMIKKWQKKIGVEVNSWGIRQMKTKWGSCNEKTKRIWLNLELVKKPESCIEYIAVHELVHLLERTHNDRFVKLMDKHFPKWRSEKEELNRLILTHEEWKH
jgi:predicted metal-dependent hydrolase